MASEVGGAESLPGYGNSSEEPENPEPVTEKADEADIPDEFSVQTWKEDLALVVEGRRLFVTSGVLGLVSPVFSTMLESLFKEAVDKPRELELPGKRYCSFVEFLRCVYPSIMKDVTQENVMVVLHLADEYEVCHLKKRCEQFLIDAIDGDTTAEELCTYLNNASKYKLDSMRSACEQVVLGMEWEKIVVAEEKFPVSMNVKVKLQNKQIATLQDTVSLLTKNLELWRARCSELEEVAKSFWVGDSKTSAMPDAGIGKLHMKIPTALKKRIFKSQSIRINDKTCFITCKIVQNAYNLIDYFEFYLDVVPLSNVYDWSCKLCVKLVVLNAQTNKDHICKADCFTLKEESNTRRVFSVEKTKLVEPGAGFVNDDTIDVKAFLLVDSTVHKAKRTS